MSIKSFIKARAVEHSNETTSNASKKKEKEKEKQGIIIKLYIFLTIVD